MFWAVFLEFVHYLHPPFLSKDYHVSSIVYLGNITPNLREKARNLAEDWNTLSSSAIVAQHYTRMTKSIHFPFCTLLAFLKFLPKMNILMLYLYSIYPILVDHEHIKACLVVYPLIGKQKLVLVSGHYFISHSSFRDQSSQ